MVCAAYVVQARMANRVRGKQRPEQPTDLEFTIDDRHVPEGFLRADVRVKDRRHLVFANDQQVALLSKAKTWYVDATLRVVNTPFTQLFSVHGCVKSGGSVKQVPLVMVVMSGKKAKDYSKV